MQVKRLLLFLLVLFAISLTEVRGDAEKTVQDKKNILSDKKYESKAAVKHFEPFLKKALMNEFKARVLVDRGSEQCFYEECDGSDTAVYVSFYSATPPSFASDGKVKAHMVGTNGSIIHMAKEASLHGSTKLQCEEQGTMALCFNNQDDRRGDKVINFQIIVFRNNVANFHLEQHYNEEDENIMYRLYDGLYQVARAVMNSKSVLNSHRAVATRDIVLSFSNSRMVKNYSILSIFIILCVSYGQVYYLKKMFTPQSATYNGNLATRA